MLNAIKKLQINSISRRFCSTSNSTVKRPFGFGRAILSGTVIKGPFVHTNGIKSLLLRTNDSKYGTAITRVYTRTNANITEGQQLYAAGHLSSNEFFLANDKKRFEFAVNTTETTLLRSCHEDINFVELKGIVLGELINTDAFTMFRLATRFLPRNKLEVESNFYTVQVHDQALRDLIRGQLGKSDIVHLQGKHHSLKVVDNDSKQRHASFIHALNIMITSPSANTVQSANDNAAVELE